MAPHVIPAARQGGDGLLLPKPGRRRGRPTTLDRRRRDRIEVLIEALIELLDVWDGDDDREGAGTDDDHCPAHDDDPTPVYLGTWYPGDPDDAEDNGDAEQDDADYEPDDDDRCPAEDFVAHRPPLPPLPPTEVFRILPGGQPEPVTVQIVPAGR